MVGIVVVVNLWLSIYAFFLKSHFGYNHSDPIHLNNHHMVKTTAN